MSSLVLLKVQMAHRNWGQAEEREDFAGDPKVDWDLAVEIPEEMEMLVVLEVP